MIPATDLLVICSIMSSLSFRQSMSQDGYSRFTGQRKQKGARIAFDRAGIINGPRPPLRSPPTLVTASTASDPPCRPRSTETMSCLPVLAIAMRMAISFASDPVTAKFTTFRLPGKVLVISSANSTAQGFEYQDDSWTSLPACSRIVSVNSGCEWPSTMHIMPAVRS